MPSYSLSVNVGRGSVDGLGSPIDPTKMSDTKIPKKYKDWYDGFKSTCNTYMKKVESIDYSYRLVQSPIKLDISKGTLECKLNYDPEDVRTYKFLGMDVDSDFNAVIKFSTGHVIVASLYNTEGIAKGFNNPNIDRDAFKEFIDSVPESAVRLIATGFKNGTIYNSIKNSKRINLSDLSDLIELLGMTISEDGMDVNDIISRPTFDSVILNIVNDEKKEGEKALNKNLIVSDKEFIRGLIGGCAHYWSDLVILYDAVATVLSALDLWSDLGKKTYGEEEFNKAFGKCVTLTNPETGEIVDRTVSFSGVATNGNVGDLSYVRTQAKNALFSLTDSIITGYGSVSKEEARSIMISNVDVNGFSDVYSLTDAELQAISVLDSLRYIDDDAEFVRGTYNMDDPDERGLFVKSAIRSYKRNFKDFKESDSYDVTEALAELVEKGDIGDVDSVNLDVATDDTVGHIVTTSTKRLSYKVDKSKLLKVLKLSNKNIDRIMKGFE